MEFNSHQAVDASHSCPNGQHVRSSVSLEPRPEPMVIMSRSVSATTDGESRKRRRFADGGDAQDEVEGGYRDAHMALSVRIADLQADVLNATEKSRQLRDVNCALETDIEKLKAAAVEDSSNNEGLRTKLREQTECNVAQLKDLDKQHAKEVTDLKTQHSARLKELEDQIVKYKRVIAAWNA